MITEIKKLLSKQKASLSSSNLSPQDLEKMIFTEDDVVEKFLRENNLSEDDVNMGELRDLQILMLQDAVEAV